MKYYSKNVKSKTGTLLSITAQVLIIIAMLAVIAYDVPDRGGIIAGLLIAEMAFLQLTFYLAGVYAQRADACQTQDDAHHTLKG